MLSQFACNVRTKQEQILLSSSKEKRFTSFRSIPSPALAIVPFSAAKGGGGGEAPFKKVLKSRDRNASFSEKIQVSSVLCESFRFNRLWR